MNILLVIHQHLDPNAGASGATLKLGEEYQRQGHNVQYFSFDDLPLKVARWGNGKASELTKAIIFPWLVASYIIKLTSRENIDVVNASTGDAWLWGKIFHKRNKAPLLVTQSHGLEHTEHLRYLEASRQGNLTLSWKYPIYNGGLRLWETLTSMRCSDLVFLLNSEESNHVIQNLGIQAERVYVFPNGISDIFLNLPFEPIPLANEVVSIALVGSYLPRKGIHYSVPALNSILLNYPQIKVSFLGTGCSATQVYGDFNSSIHDRIQVIPRYENEKLPDLLKQHQIMLLPSLYEGFSLAIVEAMACGLVPVTTGISGAKDILTDGHNSILLPTHNSLAIEQALEKLIINRAYLEQLRQNAYIAAQGYSWTQVAKKRLSIYEEALGRQKHLH